MFSGLGNSNNNTNPGMLSLTKQQGGLFGNTTDNKASTGFNLFGGNNNAPNSVFKLNNI